MDLAKAGDAQAAETRLKVDHSVPVAVLASLIATQTNRDKLRRLLLANYARGILTYQEDSFLDTRFKASMPDGWVVGDDPYARYEAMGISGSRRATPN